MIVALVVLTARRSWSETWLDYLPLNVRSTAVLWWRPDMASLPVSPMSRFDIIPKTTARGDFFGADIQWGAPADFGGPDDIFEEWATKPGCYSKNPYLWLHAFRDNHGQRFEIRTLRYEYVDLTTGQTFNATNDCPLLPDGTLQGQPYAIMNVWSQPYRIKLWMIILNADGIQDKRVYWEHTVTPRPAGVYNSCWESDAWNNRPAIEQREAWWEIWPGGGETQGRWLLGGGGVPFDRSLQPQDPGIVWQGRLNVFGLWAGIGWIGAMLQPNGEPTDFQWCMRTRE